MFTSSNQSKSILRGFAAVALTTSGLSQPSPGRLWDVLSYYGFNDSQKQAIELVMEKSGIPDAAELLRANANGPEELLGNIIKFVDLTQRHFTIRTGTQERWEVKMTEWMQDEANQKELMEAFEHLGITGEILPRTLDNGEADVLVVFGARNSAMKIRLSFAGKLFNEGLFSAKHLVLLGGERYITVDHGGISIDGSLEELNQIALAAGKNIERLTETDLMKDSYEKSDIFEKLPTTILDTPRGDLPRPTTETTMRDFLIWLKAHPDCKNIVFISNQPHVGYQAAVTRAVINALLSEEERHDLHVQVIGPACRVSLGENINPALKIRELIGALGSKLYAQTPFVVEKLNLDIEDEALKKQFLELFQRQPLIFQQADSVLNKESKRKGFGI